jgi:hypothetical protein
MMRGAAQEELHGMPAASLFLGVEPEPISDVPKTLNVRSAINYVRSGMHSEDLRPRFGDASGDKLAFRDDGIPPEDEVSSLSAYSCSLYCSTLSF